MRSFFGWLLFLTISVFLVGPFNASLFCDLWAWFVVPTFGLPELTTVQALGILTVSAYPLIAVKASIYDLQVPKAGISKLQNTVVSAISITIGVGFFWVYGLLLHTYPNLFSLFS